MISLSLTAPQGLPLSSESEHLNSFPNSSPPLLHPQLLSSHIQLLAAITCWSSLPHFYLCCFLDETYQLSTVVFSKSPPFSEIQLTPHYGELIVMPLSQVVRPFRKAKWVNAPKQDLIAISIPPSYGGRSLFLGQNPPCQYLLGNYILLQGSFSHHHYLY